MLETSKIFKKVSILLDNILCYSINMDNVFSLLLQISSFSQILQHIWFVLTLSPRNLHFFQFMLVIMFIVIIGFKLIKFEIGLCIYYHFTNIYVYTWLESLKTLFIYCQFSRYLCQKEIVLYVFLYIIILFIHKTFDIPTQIFSFSIDFKHFN